MSLNNEIAAKMEFQAEYSLEELFVAYKTPIYLFVYRYCQDEQMSHDIVQDTFVRFAKYEKRYDKEKSNIKTYLFQMAYQIMVNRLKKQERWKKLLPFFYIHHEKKQVSTDDKLTIQEAIKQLPKEHRAVVLLTYYHDLPQKEIGEILSIPVGTVKSRLHAALKTLKALLEVER